MAQKYSYKSGDIHNGLVLTGKSYIKKYIRFLEYICKCGNTGWANMYKIFNGKTTSCGCKRNAQKHGLSYHPLYKGFYNVVSRCYDQKSKAFKDYGGRGITICDEWLNDVTKFIEWAENNGWEKGLELERKDNNKGYSPDNCIWATRQIQSRNKRSNIFLEAFGEKKCVADWVNDNRCNVAHNVILYRVRKLGWDAEKAITTISKKSQAA